MNAAHTQESAIQVFTGWGSRLNRVHIFDARTGSYLTSGFTRGGALFVRKPIDLARVTIREFDRRATLGSRLAAPAQPSAARRASRLQPRRRAAVAAGTMPLIGDPTP